MDLITHSCLNELKKLLKENKIIIGTRITMKKLKSNKLEKIWLSANVPPELKEDIQTYSKINAVKVVTLGVPNDELGVLCKKQFSVSVASLVKGEK